MQPGWLKHPWGAGPPWRPRSLARGAFHGPGVSLQSVMRCWVATATTPPFPLIAMRHTGSGSGRTAAG